MEFQTFYSLLTQNSADSYRLRPVCHLRWFNIQNTSTELYGILYTGKAIQELPSNTLVAIICEAAGQKRR